MRIEWNSLGNLITWLDDGTEIIFSKEATCRIGRCPKDAGIQAELMRMIIHQ